MVAAAFALADDPQREHHEGDGGEEREGLQYEKTYASDATKVALGEEEEEQEEEEEDSSSCCLERLDCRRTRRVYQLFSFTFLSFQFLTHIKWYSVWWTGPTLSLSF